MWICDVEGHKTRWRTRCRTYNSDTSFDEHTFCLEVLSDDHEIEEWKVELSTSATCQEVRQNLMQFVLRGEVQRQVKLSERPFEDAGFMYVMEKCSTKHDLVKGQTLAHAQDSLFIIHTGEVIQMCDKLVYRHLREGSCFGETNFVKGTKSSEFSVHAISSTVVIEIHRLQVLQLTDSDSFLCARLWFTLCKVLNNNLLLSMQSTFPGIWSTPDHPDSATEELLPPAEQQPMKSTNNMPELPQWDGDRGALAWLSYIVWLFSPTEKPSWPEDRHSSRRRKKPIAIIWKVAQLTKGSSQASNTNKAYR